MTVRFSHAAQGELDVEIPPAGLIVGRTGGGAGIELDGDARISRRHGRLWVEGEDVWYEDLGSHNGSILRGERLTAPTRLQPGDVVTLGETHLSLAGSEALPATGQETVAGMELRMKRQAGSNALAEATGSVRTHYVSALYEFVQGLLRSTSGELMPLALRRLYEVVPAAQRISLVAWPPEPDGSFRHLVSPHDLGVDGIAGGPISASLVRLAVESGEAMLFSEAGEGDTQTVGASMVRHGIRSAVYVPLMRDEEAIGVLCVDTPTPALPFTIQDFRFVCAMGNLLTSALVSEEMREETRRHQLAARETEARREALSAFLKIASHDLKNPLSAIVSCARMAKRMRNPEMTGELMDIVISAGRRASNLIRSYLDVSALESGHHLEVQWTELNPREMIEEELSFLQRANQDRGNLTFVNRISCTAMRADRQKLEQIIGNLLSNAVKYSPDEGEIAVESETHDGEVIFHVRDQGVGISDEDKAKLFSEFQRVGDRSLAAGTGLGLWLTAALVQAHGGRIWVASTVGQGSTFSIAIPQPTEP